ncbi:hypothetical protein GIB67_011327 [Kingdonia uniflora]|uniref:Importin N-terminal domain-containing protein n=1 Tax=Kingdonia uniflora TaxID=39325 RepID=A0A7J7MNR3_9MAGN|nr:hypothetical protein GIB67_011327 [Kingdonia uniflora]
METLIPQIIHLLEATFSPDNNVVTSATQSLDQLSLLPDFAFALLSIATGGQDQGLRIAAATYLKNFIRRRTDDSSPSNYSKEFRNRLVQALLQAESTVLKVLIEAFQIIIAKEFVKENSWPELVPELRLVIQNSDLVCEGSSSQWSTINALTVLQAIIRPFQYFLNPNLAKETVPPQLELIAKEILVPLLIVFHRLVEKVMPITRRADTDVEKIILVVCKCIYFSVRSHMPSAIVHTLPSICGDLCGILDSLMLNGATTEDGYLLRLKAGKRSLLIFCSLVTRHWKCSDRLMPNITTCASKIVKQSINISVLDFPSERIVSLAFDVIARVVETGPGWRLVSPHFSSLIDSAIFPALVMNQKDVSEWEEDTDEYIRKNLPSDLEEISGWREDLFTVRKSAINLLGVIAMSKGPPMPTSKQSVKRKKSDKSKSKDQRCFIGEMIVLPFLSKFPIPFSSGGTSDQTMMANDYFGVLMAYGGLQDLLKEQNPVNTATLLQNRVLPMYSLSPCMPYLVATANWVLGELASCLSEEMSADVYSSLLKALVMPDVRDITCYPVRASAAGAIAGLLEIQFRPKPTPEPEPDVAVGHGGLNGEVTELQALIGVVADFETIVEKDKFNEERFTGKLKGFQREPLIGALTGNSINSPNQNFVVAGLVEEEKTDSWGRKKTVREGEGDVSRDSHVLSLKFTLVLAFFDHAFNAYFMQNDYLPPEWLPILEVVVNRMSDEDDSESSSLLQLLATVVEAGNGNVAVHIPYIVSALVGTISKRIPPIPEPWPQFAEML